MRRRTALSIFGALTASLVLAPGALATFPGDNGAIAFSRGGDIWTINPDGTGEKRLTSGAEHDDRAPEWSPDGREIFFERTGSEGPHIYRMNADGGAVAWVRPGADPQLSGDGRQLAYLGEDAESSRPAAFVAKRDGSDPELLEAHDSLTSVDDWAPNHGFILLTGRDGDSGFLGRSPAGIEAGYGVLHDDRHFNNYFPSFSPDGSRIAFATRASGISGCDDTGDPTCGGDPDVGIRTMDIGGGDLRTINPLRGLEPAWSPDGARIVFSDEGALRVVKSDGTGSRLLTGGTQPDWQPVHRAQIPHDPPTPPEPRTVTVTAPVEVPGPVRVVEKVVTRVVQGEGVRCLIPAGKRRLTLTIHTTRAVKRGASVKVTVDLASGRAKVARGKPYRVQLREPD